MKSRIPYDKLSESEKKMFDGLGPILTKGLTQTVTRPTDPAFCLLSDDPEDWSKMGSGVLRKSDCYICRDSEFARMGLPLCHSCPYCEANPDVSHSGHIPADDDVCTECGGSCDR